MDEANLKEIIEDNKEDISPSEIPDLENELLEEGDSWEEGGLPGDEEFLENEDFLENEEGSEIKEGLGEQQLKNEILSYEEFLPYLLNNYDLETYAEDTYAEEGIEPFVMFDGDVSGVTGIHISSSYYYCIVDLDLAFPDYLVEGEEYTLVISFVVEDGTYASQSLLLNLPSPSYSFLIVNSGGSDNVKTFTYSSLKSVSTGGIALHSDEPSSPVTGHVNLSIISLTDSEGNQLLNVRTPEEPGKEDPVTGELKAEEGFFTKDFSSYTVSEGLLLLIFAILFIRFCIEMTQKLLHWRGF